MAETDFRTQVRQWALKNWADVQQKDIDSLKSTGHDYQPQGLESAWMMIQKPIANGLIKGGEYMDPSMKRHDLTGDPERIRNSALDAAKKKAVELYKQEDPTYSDRSWQTIKSGNYPVSGWGQQPTLVARYRDA